MEYVPHSEPSYITHLHELSDNHAQGTHDSDPREDCYDCYSWINGYGAEVLASLSANTELTPEWWHSGGNLHGINVDYKDKNYFIGAADEPEVGMDIRSLDHETLDRHLGWANFGSLEDYSPSQMAKRIWDSIENGVGVTTVEPEPPFNGQLESNCSWCNHEPTLNHEIHYPSGNAVVNEESK